MIANILVIIFLIIKKIEINKINLKIIRPPYCCQYFWINNNFVYVFDLTFYILLPFNTFVNKKISTKIDNLNQLLQFRENKEKVAPSGNISIFLVKNISGVYHWVFDFKYWYITTWSNFFFFSLNCNWFLYFFNNIRVVYLHFQNIYGKIAK